MITGYVAVKIACVNMYPNLPGSLPLHRASL